tara:strand:- start:5000 stop:5704 length:705 start_codon:yes stop_codon:yes gene_type:complete
MAVNCSGYTGRPNVDACEDDKATCWEYNVTAPPRTAEMLNLFKIPMIHVSSGCIYQKPRKWTEEDEPNFGLYNRDSSFYSMSKHAGELALDGMDGYLLRIRMPFCGTNQHKNILVKYLKYNDIISQPNSLTSVPDLCRAIEHLAIHRYTIDNGIYNVVNKGSITAEQVMGLMKVQGLENPNWNIVKITDLNLKAGRSNCTLAGEKLWKHIQLPTVVDSLKASINKLKTVRDGNA